MTCDGKEPSLSGTYPQVLAGATDSLSVWHQRATSGGRWVVGAMVMDGESARTVTGTVRLLRQADQVGEDIQVGHELLTDAQLAERWQLSRGTLANQRSQGRGPSYIKIAGRVRYRRSDIEAYEQAGLVSTQ
jgi:predicted DNA-binding transcriptional regulator AlpA